MTNREKIEQKIDSISNISLLTTCEVIVESKFFHWPASLGFHHAYVGGLAEHTLEVCNLAETIANSGLVAPTNRDVIVAACLWHDFLKIEEYVLALSPIEGQRSLVICNNEYVGYLTKKQGKDSTHPHIKDGATRFVKTARHFGVEDGLINQIEHCILSHHGFIKEWGSEIEPKTLEALIVHQADMLSAHGGISK